MKLTLISLDQEVFTIGVRTLSSYLRHAGVEVRLIFMPMENSSYFDEDKFRRAYPDAVLDDLAELCADSGLVGVSLMTNHFLQAVQVTAALKERGCTAPVIWGGIQPTIEPEECLRHADMVCLGEGEEALLEVVQRLENNLPVDDVRNIWTMAGGALHRTELRPLLQDLDALPIPDYSCQDHYINQAGRLTPLTPDVIRAFSGDRYRSGLGGIFYPAMTSRGCPYACTYCCNHVYSNLYPHQRRLRWRSVEHVLAEIKNVNAMIGPIERILFVDDNFTARPLKDLQAFYAAYKQEVGIPFLVQISPMNITEEKLLMLLDAGCVKTTMGIETASERIAGTYNRARFHKVNRQAVEIIRKHLPRMAMTPSFQFIIDNPEETLEETLETLRMAVEMPRPWNNGIFSLMLFPGTLLYEQAIQKGLIADKTAQVYGKNWAQQSQPYFQIWIRLYRVNMPPALMNALLTPWLARLMTSRPARVLLNSRLLHWLGQPTSPNSLFNRTIMHLLAVLRAVFKRKPAQQRLPSPN